MLKGNLPAFIDFLYLLLRNKKKQKKTQNVEMKSTGFHNFSYAPYCLIRTGLGALPFINIRLNTSSIKINNKIGIIYYKCSEGAPGLCLVCPMIDSVLPCTEDVNSL